MGTIAHEIFHYIDFKNKINRRYNLYEHLQRDWSSLLKKSNGDIIWYLQQYYPDAFKPDDKRNKIILKEEYRGISDIISGLSKGQINLGYRHSSEYWKKRYRLKAET